MKRENGEEEERVKRKRKREMRVGVRGEREGEE